VESSLLGAIEERGLRYTRFVWTDNAGLIRAKAVHRSLLLRPEGASASIAMAQLGLPATQDAVAKGSGLSPAGEVELRPDWSTFRVLPYAPGQARVLTELYDGEQPWALCPRTFLRRMLERASRRGLRFTAAFENEFYLLRPSEGGWAPVDETLFGQTQALDRQQTLLDDLTSALEAQGLEPEMIYAESGGGQFELPIRFADALTAADNQVVFRETVRGVAHRHGLLGSFLPKIFPDRAGSGAHLHLSVWDGERNLTADSEQPQLLSRETRALVAGLLAHLPGLLALTTPSPNSFKRLRPRSWASAYTAWGYANREAAVRVPRQPAGAGASNVELKPVDPSCNPYLALGAVIAAALDGLERGLEAAQPVDRDPADLPPAEHIARGLRPLPSDLGAAIASLEADSLLMTVLGPQLARAILAVRRAEWEACRELPHEEEVRLLIDRY
jgi:glutamine synthetase